MQKHWGKVGHVMHANQVLLLRFVAKLFVRERREAMIRGRIPRRKPSGVKRYGVIARDSDRLIKNLKLVGSSIPLFDQHGVIDQLSLARFWASGLSKPTDAETRPRKRGQQPDGYNVLIKVLCKTCRRGGGEPTAGNNEAGAILTPFVLGVETFINTLPPDMPEKPKSSGIGYRITRHKLLAE
jgi:hypothetical protein